MNIFENIKYIRKNTSENVQLEKNVSKLPNDNDICLQILNLVDNNNVSVECREDIKNNYYFFLNNTIYLSKKLGDYRRVCVIAHECIHSIQSKILQWLNFVISNLELLGFIITVISIFTKYNSENIIKGYIVITVISIVVRLILELDATIRSIGLSKKYLLQQKFEDADKLVAIYKFGITSTFPIFLIILFYGKIFRIFGILILNNIII